MPKSNGLNVSLVNGVPCFSVSISNRATDKIYEAVEEAIISGMTAKQFRMEAAQCWEEILRDMADDAAGDLLGD